MTMYVTLKKSLKQLGALSLTRTLDNDAKLERVQVGNNIELDEEDRFDGEITQLGRLMTALPIDLKSSRMISGQLEDSNDTNM